MMRGSIWVRVSGWLLDFVSNGLRERNDVTWSYRGVPWKSDTQWLSNRQFPSP